MTHIAAPYIVEWMKQVQVTSSTKRRSRSRGFVSMHKRLHNSAAGLAGAVLQQAALALFKLKQHRQWRTDSR